MRNARLLNSWLANIVSLFLVDHAVGRGGCRRCWISSDFSFLYLRSGADQVKRCQFTYPCRHLLAFSSCDSNLEPGSSDMRGFNCCRSVAHVINLAPGE